jgi:hypothetical protein
MWRANVIVTAVLVGLIWTIQWVHYPLFAAVPAAAFPAYHAAHVARITPLVGPLMVAELVLAAAWWWQSWRAGQGLRVASVGLALVAVAWIATALLSVPLHERLADGAEPLLVAALVRTNLVRAIAWTVRLAVVAGWGGPRG